MPTSFLAEVLGEVWGGVAGAAAGVAGVIGTTPPAFRGGYGQWPAPQMTAAWGAEPWAYGAPAPGPMPQEQELQLLRDHADALKAQLDQISARIEELEKET